jgi:hypothetical protein
MPKFHVLVPEEQCRVHYALREVEADDMEHAARDALAGFGKVIGGKESTHPFTADTVMVQDIATGEEKHVAPCNWDGDSRAGWDDDD